MTLFDQNAREVQLPVFREPAVDFEAGSLVLGPGGEPVVLEGAEAVALWVRKALDAESQRYMWPAHTSAYGNELGGLLGAGRDIAENRMREMIRACLLACPYITGCDGFAFFHEGDRTRTEFCVSTVYGDILTESEATVF